MTSHLLKLVICLLFIIALLELFSPHMIKEGFTNMVGVGETANWALWAPRRGDVGPESDESGYFQDTRYFHDYTDIQRFGVKHDFCRMISLKSDLDNKFFACALAGTDNLSSTAYKTPSTKNGFRISRDDYMRQLSSGGPYSYCRILKVGNDTFETRCNTAEDKGFSTKTIEDSNPPDSIVRLVSFYEGIVFWLRLRDDIVDYTNNLIISSAGNIAIEEWPANPALARSLQFDGVNKFLRIGDSTDMTLGQSYVSLRTLRAFSFWVKFDEFTNNAHLLDFGNGAGIDNIFIGIIGKGNFSSQEDESANISTVPCGKSGAQPPPLMSPQKLMLSTAANVNDFECRSQEIFPNPKGNHLTNCPKKLKNDHHTADMIYELWDQKQRRLRMKVPGAFTIGVWTHIVITTDTNDNLRPPISVYKDGRQVYKEPAGFLPQASSTSKNYIGKSNWTSNNDPMNNKDELFKGSLFDVRAYKMPLTQDRISDFYKWGKENLGL